MTPRSLVLVCATIGLLCVCAGGRADAAAQATRLDRAFQKFWAAMTPSEAAAAVDEIVATKVSFSEALRRLKQGRPYSRQKTGLIKMTNRTEDGVVHDYAVKVPAGYDPRRRYPVRIQLHGNVHGSADDHGRIPVPADIGPLVAGAEQFYVIPHAWADAPWWSDDQSSNLLTILDALKRRYNIDENRVVVSGDSDGGTGSFYMAMCNTTPFASFLPLNAFIMVLGNEGLPLNGQLFPNNLRNKPLFVVNGGRDPFYPTDTVEPYLDHMKNNGVMIDYHPQSKAAHDTKWWPQLRGTFERFVTQHPRNPVPDTITWEIVNEHRCNRAHWLVIDGLVPPPEDPLQIVDTGRFAVKKGAANPWPLFAYVPPAGRVDVVRTDNTITATTEGVADFTLLLSPDRIDFSRPVKVVVNDTVIFDGLMEPNIKMLLTWAAADNDRTMLFGAELHVHLDV